jgi:hypothetical protein
MRIRRTLATLLAATALLSGTALATGTAAVAATPADLLPTTCSATYVDNNYLLGPEQLPVLGPVGLELAGYRRSGDLTDAQLLAQYYSPTANNGSPGWIYPPDNGYVIGPGGRPIEFTQTLTPGQDIDRYGSVYGSFLAPAGESYASRSIPPSSLDSTPAESCNYHDYRVLKPFAVDSGPIAPWFGQPGYGWQYQLDSTLVPGAPAALNVLWLLDNDYLAPVG